MTRAADGQEEVFIAQRPRLISLAGRILGSASDADDVVQEAWIRLSRTGDIDDLPAWLTTVVTRLCLDHLRQRQTRTRAEEAVPVEHSPVDPEADALLGEAMGGAVQVVLDALAPAERAAFVLHDVFRYPFEEVAAVLGRSDAAVRQLASRARRKVQGLPEPASTQADRAESRRVVEAFLAAARGGEVATLLQLLAPTAVMRVDAAGQAMGVDPIYQGAEAVAARFQGARAAAVVTIDGDPGIAWINAGSVRTAFAFHVKGGQVIEIELIADPEVLGFMDVVRPPRPGRGEG